MSTTLTWSPMSCLSGHPPVGSTLWPPSSPIAPAGPAAAGGRSKCRGGRGPSRPWPPPGSGFTVPPAAPGRRGGSIKSSCKIETKIDLECRGCRGCMQVGVIRPYEAFLRC